MNQYITVSHREAYYVSYAAARKIARKNPEMKAYWVAENATDHVLYGDDETSLSRCDGERYDYVPFVEVSKAVLWAIHWQHRQNEVPADKPKWASERHLGFTLSETETKVWYDRPRLP